ncbi:hypothetical protein ACWERY_37255 [Streptomyces sp. NPDC004082]|uniref:hypothetical protein n=1 Tax=unclassified Streptomyces TaxID=2593676 RepID=UPI0033B9F59C
MALLSLMGDLALPAELPLAALLAELLLLLPELGLPSVLRLTLLPAELLLGLLLAHLADLAHLVGLVDLRGGAHAGATFPH